MSLRTDGPVWEAPLGVVVVLLLVTPQVGLQRREHMGGWIDGRTDGWREREVLFTAARLEASCTSSWADSGVATPWAPGRSSRAHLPTAQCALAGPSVQPQEPSLLLPSGLRVSGPQACGASLCPGHFCPCVGWATVISIPPRHMLRGKSNSPGHPAPPGTALCRAVCHSGCHLRGLLCRAQPSPCPVHSRQQCVPSC